MDSVSLSVWLNWPTQAQKILAKCRSQARGGGRTVGRLGLRCLRCLRGLPTRGLIAAKMDRKLLAN